MYYAKTLRHLSLEDSKKVGGKAASLSCLCRHNFNVPDGIVVTTEAFKDFMISLDLKQKIKSILNTINLNIPHTLESASLDIKKLIMDSKIPNEIAESIMSQFSYLGLGNVAVRSSATVEDGLDHAWAGQLESFLNVERWDILNKLKLCWASLYGPRAIHYGLRSGFGSDIAVAVIIQNMIFAEKAGVAFSVHPISEDENMMLIEANYGLGESVVSGMVTPDSYGLLKDNFQIIEEVINHKNKSVYPKDGGGSEWIELPYNIANSRVLSKENITSIAKAVKDIEIMSGYACDVEWAIKDEILYILQSRPITTIKT